MSAAKHTPGPWLATCADEWTTTKGEHAQFGRYDISAGSVDPAAENYYRIASVSNVNNALANKGNARLIAAAPELLESGNGVCAAWDRYWSGGRAEADAVKFIEALNRQRAAISKAQGERPCL